MRTYYDEDELLEAKADEKLVTYFIVYRTWNEKYFNHIPSDGLVISINPTSYKTVKLAIKNKEKFATVPFIANSLDKIEIYEVLDDMTVGDYKSLKHYERESLLTKCKLVYEEDLRDKNEEYDKGFRAGRRDALREGMIHLPKTQKEVDYNKAIRAEGEEILKKYKRDRFGKIRISIPTRDEAGWKHTATLIVRPFSQGYGGDFEYVFYIDDFCFGYTSSYAKLKVSSIDKELLSTFERDYSDLVKFIKKYDF